VVVKVAVPSDTTDCGIFTTRNIRHSLGMVKNEMRGFVKGPFESAQSEEMIKA